MHSAGDVFRRVLIANRGEIALRILRSLRSMGTEAVVIHGREDRLSLPVRLADEGYYIPRDDPLASYLDIEAIVAAAKDVSADAVHPGYGFLAENAAFAQRLADEGVTFIGPTPESLRLLGDKIAAREAMSKAGIPVARGSDKPVANPEEASEIATEIGFPLIIKAASGGGGIGMQVVGKKEDFQSALRLCQGRAASAFGDDRVFLEKFIGDAEHIEFQVLGDGSKAIHLGERFCSIQRRHQKIIEESPSPRVGAALREKMGQSALRLGRALAYRSAGTVEFLVDDETGDFWFLEVNTRLQVEHPVTEYITGLDLVEWMLRIAAGESLTLTQNDIGISGWSMEARLYAEDPSRGFLPSTGRLSRYRPPATGRHVRVDSGVGEGDEEARSLFYAPPQRGQALCLGRSRDV